MAGRPDKLTKGYIAECLSYEPDTGTLVWKRRPPEHFPNARQFRFWNTKYAGKPALTGRNKAGYLQGKLDGKFLSAHRAAFACMGHELPEAVDHINGQRSDNKWENLRASCYSQNNRNRAMHSNNVSGFVGVYFATRDKKWVAKIGNGRLGFFDTKEEAIQVRKDAMRLHGGYSERHGAKGA